MRLSIIILEGELALSFFLPWMRRPEAENKLDEPSKNVVFRKFMLFFLN